MTIKNINSLKAKINNLQRLVTDDDLKKIVDKANKIYVQAEAKLLCSVNHGELRNSIRTSSEIHSDMITAITYTNKSYASYIEFGTGPVGQSNHEGISPEINPSYSQHGWGIPADKVDSSDAERYHWPKRIYNGKEYYMTSGQPAKPFLYPALKNNEVKVKDEIARGLVKKVKKEVFK